jgi:hypothetical protein
MTVHNAKSANRQGVHSQQINPLTDTDHQTQHPICDTPWAVMCPYAKQPYAKQPYAKQPYAKQPSTQHYSAPALHIRLAQHDHACIMHAFVSQQSSDTSALCQHNRAAAL